MRGIWAGALLAVSVATMVSPSISAPVECAGISNDLDRLACYDREVGRTPTAVISQSAGKWAVQTEKNKLTDRTDIFLSVESDETVNCGWNRNDKVRLIIRCHENTTSMIVQTGCHMTSSEYNDYGDVTYRIDQEPAKTIGMSESTNNRSLGLWNGGRSIPVIKQMLGKSQVIMKMTPYGENPFTATFQIAGLEKAIEPLRKECKW